ncbi:MAG TPA: S8 family serine peptidase [Candidatus Elarobacter sp.]
MKFRPLHWLTALLSAAVLAACHGGGSHPKVAPTPGPTLDPRCTALSPQTTGSTYSLTSNPSGITVQRVDPANTTVQCVYFTGVTSTSDRPQTAPHPWNYVFAAAQPSPYIVSIDQAQNGNHTLFYNQAGDSFGSISVGSLKSVNRNATGTARGSGVGQRGIRRFSGAGVVTTEVLVRFHGTPAQGRLRSQQVATDLGGTSGGEIVTAGGSYERFVHVPAGTDAATFAQSLGSRGDVADVFPVHKRFPLGKPAQAVNDTHGNNVDQWYLFADGFPNAWSYANGSKAKIAVIDTGIDLNNTDLMAHYAGGQSIYHDTPDIRNPCAGPQVINSSPQDSNGHGTNTAGIAAAAANNAVGFAGASDNANLLAYDIFQPATPSTDQQSACVPDEVQAIQTAVAAGADVISMSLGSGQNVGTASDGFDQGEHDAVEAAIAAGVTVVAAAGNDADGGESGTPHTVLDYPAAYDGVISVGASALRDNNSGTFAGSTEYVAPYSQYGPGLSIVAPGGDPSGNDSSPLHWIWNYSTSTAAFGSAPGEGDKCRTPSPATSCTEFFAGTSQATPQGAAAAALLISSAGGRGSLTPARVKRLLEETADNINDPHQGHGRLNAYKALAALNADVGAYSGPTPQKTSPTQIVAFGYSNSGGTVPTILDVNYPAGVPVDSAGNFRIGDIPASAGTYRVGVWYDANGNGTVDAGDQFGSPATSCNATQRCTIGTVTMVTVTAGFTLP